MKPRLTVTIITLNEERNLQRCLDSLKGLNAEIVLVDSGSTDKTLEIARNYGAKTYFRKFDNFANQKNFALSKTEGKWILSVDADEEITIDLAKEIKEKIKDSQYAGYLIQRRNFIFGKEIKHSRWSPDRHIWLWKRTYGKWVGEVHEEVEVFGKVGLLKNSKIHHSHENISSFMEANNLYSTLEARSLFRNNIRFSFGKMLGESLFEFFLRFFYKKGFLDESYGFILAYLMGIYKLTVWIKIWELEQRK